MLCQVAQFNLDGNLSTEKVYLQQSQRVIVSRRGGRRGDCIVYKLAAAFACRLIERPTEIGGGGQKVAGIPTSI